MPKSVNAETISQTSRLFKKFEQKNGQVGLNSFSFDFFFSLVARTIFWIGKSVTNMQIIPRNIRIGRKCYVFYFFPLRGSMHRVEVLFCWLFSSSFFSRNLVERLSGATWFCARSIHIGTSHSCLIYSAAFWHLITCITNVSTEHEKRRWFQFFALKYWFFGYSFFSLFSECFSLFVCVWISLGPNQNISILSH